MNVSEKVRSLLAAKREKETGLPAYLGVALEDDRRRKRAAWGGREPSGEDLRRWARGQERAGKKQAARANREIIRKRRGALPNAREMFPVLQRMRLAARPVVGYDKDKKPVYGPSTFRNVIDENGRHI